MENNLEFKKIKSIKRLKKKQKVYNFNVPGYESYVANGFVVHNCENHKISQSDIHSNAKKFSVNQLIKIAKEKHCESICMTYNEPTVYYEFLLDLANACHDNDLKFIIKTNAYINEEPWEEVCKVVDAMNIDFKGAYQYFENITECRFIPNYFDKIRTAITYGVHVEISIPIFSGIDMLSDLHYLISQLAAMGGADIPCHLLKVNPAYFMIDYPTTSDEEIGVVDRCLSGVLANIYV